MECIFLYSTKACAATTTTYTWKPDNETLKTFCETANFGSCPRYQAYMELQEKSTTMKLKTK